MIFHRVICMTGRSQNATDFPVHFLRNQMACEGVVDTSKMMLSISFKQATRLSVAMELTLQK